MRDIELHEAMGNLNPCTDKLGRERDFKDAMNAFVKWTDNEIDKLKEKIKELECQLDNMK